MFLPYGRQTIEEDDITAVSEALCDDFLTTGPRVEQFERALADATGAAHVVACSNGTTALHLAYIAMGIGPGDAVIVPSITFLATANAARYCGADIVFCDVDPRSGLMRVQDVEEAIKRCRERGLTPKAIAPVHLGGHLCDLEALKHCANEHNMLMLTDACHAIGGRFKEHKVGACQFEDMATFSFHPVKTIAMGEGGAITTKNAAQAEQMRILRSHGMQHTPHAGPWIYDMPELGYNYRLTDIQCALGMSQLQKLERFMNRRRALAEIYDNAFAEIEHIDTPIRTPNSESGWHLYALSINFDAIGKDRAHIMNELKARGIGTQVHYIPVHTQSYYTGLYGALSLPGAQEYYARTLSIPFYPTLRNEDAVRVVETIHDICHAA